MESRDVIGRAYTEGRLSAKEAATLLGMHTMDAAAWLEQSGYIRELNAVRLTEEQRQQMFAEMRSDRLQRMGRPAFSSAAVKRDAVASQRIEGIDARPWLPPLDERDAR